MITRTLEQNITNCLPLRKVIIIYGARQVGKTSLITKLFGTESKALFLNGESLETQSLFQSFSLATLQARLAGRNLLIIDEAQNIVNIGFYLKQIYDNLKDVQIIVTGSSSFDLANKINEPLTGRKVEFQLFPISYKEMVNDTNGFAEHSLIPHRMVYGYYPEVVSQSGLERLLLDNLSSSYLYKDILTWERIKKSDRIVKLLQALAFQIGSQVSYNELGQLCNLDYKTIESYISLLEQAFIIFRLPSYARNHRNELKFSKKIYFCDNGIRNAIINNFSDINLRNDAGALWENFVIAERLKKNHYDMHYCSSYFWRTNTQIEIDYLEEYDGQLHAYELKWNPTRKAACPKSFLETYPHASFDVITPENIEQFLL